VDGAEIRETLNVHLENELIYRNISFKGLCPLTPDQGGRDLASVSDLSISICLKSSDG